jgi:hypothetical protein
MPSDQHVHGKIGVQENPRAGRHPAGGMATPTEEVKA